MTRMDSDGWVPKALKLKAYRDHHREKFFRDVGLSKGAHVRGITGAAEQQRQFVHPCHECKDCGRGCRPGRGTVTRARR